MDSMILAFAFAATILISACVVLTFSASIDQVLYRLIPEEIAPAWCQYVKFALFTVAFAGGMRLTELEALVAQRQPTGQPPLTAGQSLLEVFRTISGSLVATSGMLLVFFVSTLAAYAAFHAYQSYQSSAARRRAADRTLTEAGRPSSGTVRHSDIPAGAAHPSREH